MSKERPAIGANGLPLPILPPERDVRVWAKLTRVVVYTPGFLALLLLKVGEPTGFGITVELLMLASTAAIVAGLFIGTQSNEAGADHSSRVAAWSGGLVLELLCAVPILCAVPGLFHELANSKLLHSAAPGAVAVPLGITELLPAVAILPFMLYQLAGFGTLALCGVQARQLGTEYRHPRSDPGQHRRQPHGRVRRGKGAGRHAGHRHGAGRFLWRHETAPDADRI
jgi:hypothetical protein